MKMDACGVLWFRDARQYAEYLEICEDADRLPATYDRWKEVAEKSIARGDFANTRLIKIDAEPEEIARWCAAEGKVVNAEARKLYTSAKALEKLVSEV